MKATCPIGRQSRIPSPLRYLSFPICEIGRLSLTYLVRCGGSHLSSQYIEGGGRRISSRPAWAIKRACFLLSLPKQDLPITLLLCLSPYLTSLSPSLEPENWDRRLRSHRERLGRVGGPLVVLVRCTLLKISLRAGPVAVGVSRLAPSRM